MEYSSVCFKTDHLIHTTHLYVLKPTILRIVLLSLHVSKQLIYSLGFSNFAACILITFLAAYLLFAFFHPLIENRFVVIVFV